MFFLFRGPISAEIETLKLFFFLSKKLELKVDRQAQGHLISTAWSAETEKREY